jgi:hypothetical protein
MVTAACSGGAAGSGPGSTKPAAEILADAAARSAGQALAFTQSYGSALASTGAQDAAGRNWQATVTFNVLTSGITVRADVVGAGAEVFAKLDFGPVTGQIPGLSSLGDRWLRLDPKKIGRGLARGLTSGGAGIAPGAILRGVVAAEWVGDADIKGVVDLGTSAPGIVAPADLAALSAADKRVPFVASLDTDGRLAKIVLTMPAIGSLPAADLVASYSAYGSTVVINKPDKRDTVAAPAMIYQLLV